MFYFFLNRRLCGSLSLQKPGLALGPNVNTVYK